MLKQHLGAERFWAAIRTYLTDHAYATATSDDLRQAVLAATGESLDWFWSQWIYQAGHPEFDVSAAYDSAAAALTLTVRQTQSDTASPGPDGVRFTTPQAFRAPVAIRVGTSAGDVVTRVVIDRREQTVRIEGVRGAPTMVAFDDENAVVKTLAFQQPTAWLATLLQRHPNLWNRSWAIGQLASRTSDTLAAAALAQAATVGGLRPDPRGGGDGAGALRRRAGAARARARARRHLRARAPRGGRRVGQGGRGGCGRAAQGGVERGTRVIVCGRPR